MASNKISSHNTSPNGRPLKREAIEPAASHTHMVDWAAYNVATASGAHLQYLQQTDLFRPSYNHAATAAYIVSNQVEAVEPVPAAVTTEVEPVTVEPAVAPEWETSLLTEEESYHPDPGYYESLGSEPNAESAAEPASSDAETRVREAREALNRAHELASGNPLFPTDGGPHA